MSQLVCVRCGREVTNSIISIASEGLPTCIECLTTLSIDRNEIKLSERRCPIDSEYLEQRLIHNVQIDSCRMCGGVWLDKGELDLILEGTRLEASNPIADSSFTKSFFLNLNAALTPVTTVVEEPAPPVAEPVTVSTAEVVNSSVAASKLAGLPVGLNWERLGGGNRAWRTHRAKVPGGWLVLVEISNADLGVTFYPDPNHHWGLEGATE